ncbi:type VI secretion system lipoprotein TssJ [Legionella londiniensis]|uniref:Type VI secretion lipoprotein n=1 Tax=Legionella londiniensis TaxID=45068 RepID=A0A0W0VT73_9GAMM|nr:type VI secretion system lipoprotein TssJ [Legionella londiniensis]KTD23263.1 Type VI secretion lipoprotein [Legionella londiniensis]STX93725.1 Uncharacterized protein conserved in bacteria [Legionella londiniensis]
MNIIKAVFGCGLLFLSACNSLPKPPVQVQLTADKYLNPDPKLVALPVRIKIYQLTDALPFKEATFRQLWKSDKACLGSSLLDKRELTLVPGEKQLIKMPRHPQAEYIAVVGIFRKHHALDWKAIKSLPGQVNSWLKPLNIVVKNDALEIQ